MELNKELQQWKQTAHVTQLELDVIRQRLKSDFDLDGTLNELSSILDRKKLIMETLQNNVVSQLTTERDEWRSKYEKDIDEKSEMERTLKAEMLRYQNECTRLEVEWEAARKLVGPLEVENNELRAQCREITDDLISCQKQISENQLNNLNVKVALNESIMLQKQLEESLATAECKFFMNVFLNFRNLDWQTRCEQAVLERANEPTNEGQEQVRLNFKVFRYIKILVLKPQPFNFAFLCYRVQRANGREVST